MSSKKASNVEWKIKARPAGTVSKYCSSDNKVTAPPKATHARRRTYAQPCPAESIASHRI